MRRGHANKRGHCLICAAPALMKRAEVNLQVLQDVLRWVDRGFDGFFQRVIGVKHACELDSAGQNQDQQRNLEGKLQGGLASL